MADYTLKTPAWARDFDNRKRHCFEDIEGRRWLQGFLNTECRTAFLNTECRTAHDPKLTGKTEWLRFIHEFGETLSAYDNPFTSDSGGFRLLNDYCHPTSDGRLAYCETYLRPKSDIWGLSPVFRVFLANESGWARIECYEEDLVGNCETALAAVEASYR